MKSAFVSVAFSVGLAVVALGCAANTQAPGTGDETRGAQPPAVDEQQQNIAKTTLALENAYDVQFVKGQVDRQALQPLIYDVLQSMPEQMRPKAEAHIYDVIASGEKDAKNMTPEQRADLASPVSADKMSKQQVDYIGAWGWGPYLGTYGYGAYAPYGAYGYGAYAPYGAYGYGAYAPYGYGAAYGTAYGTAYGVGYGGLGCGWGWGGLGAFAWPGYYGGLWG